MGILLDLPTPTDAEPLIRLFMDPSVREYLGGALSREDAERRVHGIIAGEGDGLVRAIRSESGAAIGLVWLSPHHGGPDTELSFVLLREWWGRGHAFEATSEGLRHAFEVLRLPKVVSQTQSANRRSIALLERLGMTLERRLLRFGAEQSIYAIANPVINSPSAPP